MTDQAGPFGGGGGGSGGGGGAPQAIAGSLTPQQQAEAQQVAAAEAAAFAHRLARTPSRTRRQVPDAPRDETEEPAPKRRRKGPKKGARGRRRRALRNTPSDVWASIFKALPDPQRELPKLRLVCRQFDDTVCGRVLAHCRPNRAIRDAQLSTLLQRFPILQSLDTGGCDQLTGAWLRDLEHHTTIKRLVLDDCPRLFPPRESGYWIYISAAERLEHLSVANNPHFGLEDLQLAYELESLQSLNVSGCSAITPDALLLFGQDPAFARTLTSLHLSRLPKLDDPSMAGLPGLSSLRELNLRHCPRLTREGLGFAAPLPNLTALNVEGCAKLSPTGAALGVSALASLRRLDMSWLGSELEPEGPDEERDSAALRLEPEGSDEERDSAALRAANNGYGWAGWAEALAGCLSHLEELRAGGAAATDFDVLALRPLTTLTALDLSDSPDITSDGVSALLPLKRLARLSLEGCLGVGDEGVAHIALLPALTELDLGACDEVSDTALESLAAASRLVCLNAVDCSVKDDAVAALKKALPRLAVAHTRAPEGYWELVITDSEDDFDDLDGEEWEVMLMEAGENSDNASDDEAGGAAGAADVGADAAAGDAGAAGVPAVGQPAAGVDGGHAGAPGVDVGAAGAEAAGGDANDVAADPGAAPDDAPE